MNLTDLAAAAFNGATARLRRDAIAYAALAMSMLAAMILAVWACVLALEPRVGAVYALLIMAAVFAVAAGGIVIGLRIARQPPRPATPLHATAEPAAASARSAQFAQLAMIVEAVLLGYSLSRRSDRR